MGILGCEILPRPGDTQGVQGAGRWDQHARVVVDTDPRYTVIHLRVDTGLTPATAVELADGTTTFNVEVTADPVIVQSIIDNPSAWYFNVHSPLNPGGFARGQLVPVQ